MKPHPHAETIIAWANGALIQFRDPNISNKWHDAIRSPEWREDHEYRVKPAEPEREYPVTNMTPTELRAFWQGQGSTSLSLTRVADAALRHACDNGQIFPREEFDRAVGDRNARDIEVMKATATFLNQCLKDDPRTRWQDLKFEFHEFHFAHIAKIIKGVTNV